MPKFNYLRTDSEFPHIGNVDTFKYDNDLDYGRFDYTQMRIQICTVPWDMGEAHIGNRSISGIGNVVHFGTKEKRDAWFAAIPDSECYRFSTKYKKLHNDLYIDVPIPFDMVAKHNYLVVEYSKFANDDSPLQYEGDDGMRKWFWFIREVEFMAPNNTRLHILDDAFQTWIYDVNISGMVLERGHAPMFAMKADRYLSNPIGNNDYLLTEDVNFGDAEQVSHIDALALNAGDMYACIATTANPTAGWGAKSNNSWLVPARSFNNSDGVPSVFVFAVTANNLNSFLANVDSTVPQFKQTIQGVFFASSQLVTTNGSFQFANTTCYYLTAGRKTLDFVDLGKSEFGYPTKYADIAKLYTSPYAHIEITDENGNTDVIKIEDTTGTINLNAAMSLAYPFVTIDSYLTGVGGLASANVTFRNIDARTINLPGRWYDTIKTWDVPIFAVIQQSGVNYDYSTHYERNQRVVDYTTAYDNATASAQTAYDNATASAATNNANATASAATANANENASAATIVDNADVTIDANSQVNGESQLSASRINGLTNSYNTAIRDADNLATQASASASIAADEQQGVLAASTGAMTGAIGAGTSALAGDAVGAVSSLANAAIGANTAFASTSIGAQLTQTGADLASASNTAHTREANQYGLDKVTSENRTSENICDINNDMIEAVADNNSATMIANAGRTLATENANAGRTLATENANAARSLATDNANAARSRNRAISAISNDIAQANINAPMMFGEFSNGDCAATKPIGVFAHIVTQSRSAISSAGDEMLRYGYRFDKQWAFDGNWNVGKYFTYWKLRDFWVSNLNVPDMYMDKLRFFLFGGVTVWRTPEQIGKVTIYDNFS